MAGEVAGGQSADDREVLRLAKARLVRVCRLNGEAAEQTLARAAAEQRAPLVAVAMRVLAASPEDLAAGRVVPVERPGGPRRPTGPQQRKPPYQPPHGKRRKGRR